MLDPALTRPGRMGRHIYFRTPTWEDRRDIFDLYLGKVVARGGRSTREKARDELARITNGYSPAMIDQACSLALTYAHSDGRMAFTREDLVEAMTTVESGVAIGQPYPKHEERATAIHEAGHAVCGHVYMENRVSTRLSIRKRGSSGGHHQAMEIEDRFGHWRSEQVGDLIWGLGAMAAEHVFYDQNTTGVGGDIGMVTCRAAQMVGRHGMAPGADRPVRPDRRPGGARGGRRRSWSASRSSACSSCTAPASATRRRATSDADEAQAGRRAARPGLRGRLEHDPRQPGRHRLHRRAA